MPHSKKASKLLSDFQQNKDRYYKQGGGDFFSIDDDEKKRIRILPPLWDEDYKSNELILPWIENWMHGNRIGANFGGFEVEGEDRNRMIYCLNEHTESGGCPVCEIVEADSDLDGLEANPKFYMLIVDYEDGNKIKYWNAPKSVATQIADLMETFKKSPSGGRIYDPKKGRDLQVHRFKTGRGKRGFVKYEITHLDPTPLTDIEDGWEEKVKEMDPNNLVTLFSRDEIITILANNIGQYLDVNTFFNRGRKALKPAASAKAEKPSPAAGKKAKAKGKK